MEAEATKLLDSVEARVISKHAYFVGLTEGEIKPDLWRDIPRSLTKVRKWHRPELGLHAISRPNDFVTTHSTWGNLVKEIGEALVHINRKYPLRPKKPDYVPASIQAAESETRAIDAEAQLLGVCAQFHVMKEDLELSLIERDVLRVQRDRLQERCKQVEADNRALRRGNLRVVK